jgi:thymidylate synthase ThyX
MRATGNLRGWLAFMKLRSAESAQWEIRQYSNVVGQVVKDKFPRTWELFAGARS